MFSSATFLEVTVRGSLKTDKRILNGAIVVFTYMELKIEIVTIYLTRWLPYRELFLFSLRTRLPRLPRKHSS
jgi:hypothetical protein